MLAEIGPEVERNIAATHAELHEEAELLSELVAETLERAGAGAGATAIAAEELRAMRPGLRRLVLRELAAGAPGRTGPGQPRAGRPDRAASRPIPRAARSSSRGACVPSARRGGSGSRPARSRCPSRCG